MYKININSIYLNEKIASNFAENPDMRLYHDMVVELEGKNIYPAGSYYFDFTEEDHPLRNQFEALHRFGQDFLDRTDLEFATDKARFFFSNRRAPKAYSLYADGYYLIDFFMGLIEAIDTFYSSREQELNDTAFDSLKTLLSRLGIAPKDFFIRNTSQLYFYHEATHFIQNYNEHDRKIPFTDEQKASIKLPIQLIREFDADWYGAASVAIHAGEAAAPEDIVELAIMSLASFLLYWVERWNMNDLDITKKDRSHPHPLVRLTTWIVSLSATMQSVFGYAIDVTKSLDKALNVAIILEGNSENCKCKAFGVLMQKHRQEIIDFVLEIQENADHYPFAANNNR